MCAWDYLLSSGERRLIYCSSSTVCHFCDMADSTSIRVGNCYADLPAFRSTSMNMKTRESHAFEEFHVVAPLHSTSRVDARRVAERYNSFYRSSLFDLLLPCKVLKKGYRSASGLWAHVQRKLDLGS